MAEVLYTTIQGDMIDLVCLKVYGRTAKVTEAVAYANPGLAAYGPVLPIGVVIRMPDIPRAVTARPLQSLWD